MKLEKKIRMFTISAFQAVISAISLLGLVYAFIRNIFQTTAIKDYSYSIGEEFKVETQALLLGSLITLIVATIVCTIIKRKLSGDLASLEQN